MNASFYTSLTINYLQINVFIPLKKNKGRHLNADLLGLSGEDNWI